jgi:hypothetical protein
MLALKAPWKIACRDPNPNRTLLCGAEQAACAAGNASTAAACMKWKVFFGQVRQARHLVTYGGVKERCPVPGTSEMFGYFCCWCFLSVS